uniref:Uncharacterized protein n=1 Tax=Panagrolaimus davidi TaxID=227884 RepID=A0A914PWU4_9BILA
MYVDGLHRFFGLEARKMKKENPAHGISNLIELMSTDDLYDINDPIFKDHGPNEKFDYREQILCFYMLKFLEEHFKVIEDETGNKIEEIAIWPVFKDETAFKERILLYSEEPEDIKFNFLELDLPE